MKDTRAQVPFDRQGWLVVAAWTAELARLNTALPQRSRRGLRTAVVGVGLVEAAHNTARLIALGRPSGILLIGTAGSYPAHERAFPTGTAAVVEETVLLPTLGPSKHTYLPAIVPSRAKATPKLVEMLCRLTRLPAARVACPLAITAGSRAATAAAKVSGCALENLEAFAVARAAAAADLPFVAILGIANKVGPQGHREWMSNARRAAAAACEAAIALLLSHEKPQSARTG